MTISVRNTIRRSPVGSAVVLAAISIFLVTVFLWPQRAPQTDAADRTPILVELFTSEGCSSCPPADAMLERFDRLQPIPGAQLIVLSEHVDYWNNLGWNDPYSSHQYSERQSGYATRFGIGAYTPQMVVEGESQFVGGSSRSAEQAVAKAIRSAKIPIHLSAVVNEPTVIRAQVEIAASPDKSRSRSAEVYLALALNHTESHVLRGENAKRVLTHTAVVRNLVRIGMMERGQDFAKSVDLKVEPGSSPQDHRLVAFIQESGQGRILGAALQTIAK
jgi:hypothetical protein